jgi:uncharacterized protein YndB with AHSA1/START domain
MDEFHGSATARIRADADAVFDLITNLDRLPEWNRAIARIVERPARLVEAAEWVVVMRPPRAPSWKSRSRIEEIDRKQRRFSYTSRNEDGNPSYARWSWEIRPANHAAEVTVRWDVYLKTIDRKLIAAPLRRRGLGREVPSSLRHLESLATATSPGE